jgi:hypothetical protein
MASAWRTKSSQTSVYVDVFASCEAGSCVVGGFPWAFKVAETAGERRSAIAKQRVGVAF